MQDLSFLFADLDLEDDHVLQRLELSTQQVTLLSHTHGRDRRAERGIKKRELQAAVLHGSKERAGSGRNNEKRWKFTYNGVVYITDETMRHEITSWRVDEKSEERSAHSRRDIAPDVAATAHIVLVVDHSSSMKSRDIGRSKTCDCNMNRGRSCPLCRDIPTRTAAVYDSIVEQLLLPQLRLQQQQPELVAELSLIEMSQEAKIAIRRAPVSDELLHHMRNRRNSVAKSHGNYLCALDKVIELAEEDKGRSTQVAVVFLSDGAPSDHVFMSCEHGTFVWREAPGQERKRGRAALAPCPKDSRQRPRCRQAVREGVLPLCLQRIRSIWSTLGGSRVSLATVAFGPEAEDYSVLEAMALEAPGRGSYSKLGLSTEMLSAAMTSVSGTLTSMLTVGAGKRDLRSDVWREDSLLARVEMSAQSRLADRGEEVPLDPARNHMFFGPGSGVPRGGCEALSKSVWLRRRRDGGDVFEFVEDPRLMLGRGVAYRREWFGEGAERFCFRGSEFVPRGVPGSPGWACDGPPLVVKEARHLGNHLDAGFHDASSKVQQMSRVAAESFNSLLGSRVAEWAGGGGQLLASHCHVNFLETSVYRVTSPSGSERCILAERFLEGSYTKWNNNFGSVLPSPAPRPSCPPARGRARAGLLGSISEEQATPMPPPPEPPRQSASEPSFEAFYDVPQCFSHFTFSLNFEPRVLVCDLQGTWNPVDGFQFTDPVVHSMHESGESAFGPTDRGGKGVEAFFQSHTCSRLCALMGLRSPQQQLEALRQQREARR